MVVIVQEIWEELLDCVRFSLMVGHRLGSFSFYLSLCLHSALTSCHFFGYMYSVVLNHRFHFNL